MYIRIRMYMCEFGSLLNIKEPSVLTTVLTAFTVKFMYASKEHCMQYKSGYINNYV